uniref:Uncharacterized protein n=1 Tax=Medicago truncatula TaxID=3880 RepID=B7FNB9_MEDTR|nr:unknown [Medicago truncatula]
METCPSCATSANCSVNPMISGSSWRRFNEVALTFEAVISLNMLNRITGSLASLVHCDDLPFRQYEES